VTSALVGGGWSAPRPGRFTPEKEPVPIVQEAGWVPGPGRVRKIATQPGFDPQAVQAALVAIPTELPGPQSCRVVTMKSEIPTLYHALLSLTDCEKYTHARLALS
jgi:hypothetical protein